MLRLELAQPWLAEGKLGKRDGGRLVYQKARDTSDDPPETDWAARFHGQVAH